MKKMNLILGFIFCTHLLGVVSTKSFAQPQSVDPATSDESPSDEELSSSSENDDSLNLESSAISQIKNSLKEQSDFCSLQLLSLTRINEILQKVRDSFDQKQPLNLSPDQLQFIEQSIGLKLSNDHSYNQQELLELAGQILEFRDKHLNDLSKSMIDLDRYFIELIDQESLDKLNIKDALVESIRDQADRYKIISQFHSQNIDFSKKIMNSLDYTKAHEIDSTINAGLSASLLVTGFGFLRGSMLSKLFGLISLSSIAGFRAHKFDDPQFKLKVQIYDAAKAENREAHSKLDDDLEHIQNLNNLLEVIKGSHSKAPDIPSLVVDPKAQLI